MSEAENSSLCSFQKEGNDAPPPLSIKLPKLSDLPGKCKAWRDDQLPVDIVLLTVEDCEFLACYGYMRNSVKRYHINLGYVYFGCMGDDDDDDDDDDDPLKVALLRCSAGSSEPGGAQTVAKNAVMKLKPKAIFSVGCCEGLKPENTQLGDVVIPSMLTTEYIKTPVGKHIAGLIRSSAEGWNPPLEWPDARQVHVHHDGEILSCIDKETAKSYPRAIAREMEGKGIFGAAHDLKMEWMIVKGISHFADSSKTPDEAWKSHACVMAASLVFKMLNDRKVFKQWPHYKDLSVEEESSASQLKREFPRSSSRVPKRRKISADLSAEEKSLVCQLTKQIKISEAFPLEKCQERLKSKYDDLCLMTISPWDPTTAVHIDTIYTRLSWCKANVKRRGKMKKKLEDYTDIFTCQEHRNPKRFLVYGRPGIGKSTFCKKAAYHWSQQSKPILRKFDLVLLVKLREVCNLHHVSTILKASELLDNDSNISVDSLCNYIQENQDKVLLILDGYDEYSCDGVRESPVRDIWKRNQLSECTVVLTMRPTHELKSHLCFEINGFDSEHQVKMFSQKFLKDESDVEEFYKYLKEHDLNEIAEIPLVLRMLCLLWTEKDLTRNLSSRANIYTRFTQTMLDHLSEKEDAKQFQNKYAEEFSKLGKFAYDALLKGNLTLLKSELSDDLQKIVNKFIRVGLCHVFQPSRVDPKEEVSFIHKTIQEYIASRYLKELVISTNDKEATFLPELDSIEKILKVKEVLEFASELSECSARVILNHLWRVAKHEDLTSSLETIIAMKTPSLIDLDDLSIYVTNFLMLTVRIFCCCSAESRQNLSPSVLLINSKQLHRIANQHLLKSTEPPNLIFFPDEFSNHSERDYRDLITVMEDLNAVVESCSGVENASRFLKKYPVRPIREFFLKKEENMHLYFGVVENYSIQSESNTFPFPTEMLKELIASPESTAQKRKNSDAHQSSEQNTRTVACSTQDTDSPFYPTHHCLSLVWSIDGLYSSEVEREVLTEMMPLVIAPQRIYLDFVGLQLIESIHITDRLHTLFFVRCLTEDMSAIIARFLRQTTNLSDLDLSSNQLGEGVSVLTQLLRCVPRLENLCLENVFMTKKQVYELSTAVHQNKISELVSLYHDRKGNPLPEDEWPSEDYWNERRWLVPSSAKSKNESGSSAESEDEPESSAESKDEPGSSAESEDEPESSAES